MGYYVVRKLAAKKRPWKVQWVVYKGDAQVTRDLPETEFQRLGFHAEMTLEQAKARRDQLNAQAHLQATEEKRVAIGRRLEREEKTLDAYLDRSDVAEFEQTILFARLESDSPRNRAKVDSHWRMARRIICELKLEPQDWEFHRKRFYDAFAKRKLSPSYTQKIIAILNLWGRYHSRKYRKFFELLPFPRGHEKERIADRYYDKNEHGNVSEPITPEMLANVEGRISPEWYHWFYLSVWFGLRPFEVDQLAKPPDPRTWTIGAAGGAPFLAVYQTKLSAVPREKRTKIIPCIVKEQTEGLRIIREETFTRPSHNRHIHPYFGEHVTLYGGRKGFAQLMRGLGQSIEDYTSWLGHQTMERTFKDYKDKQAINFTPVKRR